MKTGGRLPHGWTRSARRAVGRVLSRLPLWLLLSACASEPARTPLERSADLRLTEQVERALQLDDRIYARHIDVEVKRGVAHLSGFVFDSDDLFEAKRVSADVPGVVAVVNELELLVGGRGAAR